MTATPEQLADLRDTCEKAIVFWGHDLPDDEAVENQDFYRLVLTLLADLAAANEDAARLAEELADTKGYVGDYFWEKWGYDEALAAHRARLAGNPQAEPTP